MFKPKVDHRLCRSTNGTISNNDSVPRVQLCISQLFISCEITLSLWATSSEATSPALLSNVTSHAHSCRRYSDGPNCTQLGQLRLNEVHTPSRPPGCEWLSIHLQQSRCIKPSLQKYLYCMQLLSCYPWHWRMLHSKNNPHRLRACWIQIHIQGKAACL